MTERLTVARPAGGWSEPWPRVFEIAHSLPEDRWALVGGLMVQAHALAAGVATNRVTLDVDAAVRVEAGAFSYPDAAAALVRLGYEVDGSTRLAYRFTRGDDVEQRGLWRRVDEDVKVARGGVFTASCRTEDARVVDQAQPTVSPVLLASRSSSHTGES